MAGWSTRRLPLQAVAAWTAELTAGPVAPLRGKAGGWAGNYGKKMGSGGHVSVLLPESQGAASTEIKKDTSLRDLGNGAANSEIREERRQVNEDQLYLSRIQKRF